MSTQTMRKYNAPPATPSTIGTQMNDFHYHRKALIEAEYDQFFLPLASVREMPKNTGKVIKQYHYLPLLHDGNINSQGLDAAGAVIDITKYEVDLPSIVMVMASAAAATAAVNAINAVEADVATADGATVTLTKQRLPFTTLALAAAVASAVPGATTKQGSGNLYGSTRDAGRIHGRFPSISETGGRVNRVGFTRITIEGTMERFGFYDEYTEESVDFDSDPEMRMHVSREMITGASKMSEDFVQLDLLNNAGVVKYPGAASSKATIDSTTVTYRDLLKLHLELGHNRTPLSSTMFTGSRLTDTKTTPGSRMMYIGHELQPLIEEMKDLHNERAFIPVQQYGAGVTPVPGEIGQLGYFRIIVNPEMMHFAGQGGSSDGLDGFYETNGRLDVFPMLVVGEGSFTTIGFKTDGTKMKFTIYHKEPGRETADRFDPFGETGFMSIKWYYGFMLLRGERLALQLSSAKL